MEKVNFYIDMDGVLARWDWKDTIDDTFQPGYFLKRIPEPETIKLVKLLRDSNEKVAILSAVYTNEYAAAEKTRWLENQGIGDVPRMFVPYGKKKSDYIEEGFNVLLDDFSKNLHEWEESGNLGFKFYNGLNGSKGSWRGNCIHNRMDAETMYRVLTSVGKSWANEQNNKAIKM